MPARLDSAGVAGTAKTLRSHPLIADADPDFGNNSSRAGGGLLDAVRHVRPADGGREQAVKHTS